MMRRRVGVRRRRGTKPDEIDDLEDAERVDNEERDEPFLLTAARRVPERVPLQDDGPERHHKDNGDKDAHQPWCEWGIERCVCLHMSVVYHTLLTMRYLGVDYGSSRIGLALSDELGTMGFPHSIVPNTPRLIDELCALIAKENIGAVVIGESRTLAGGENPIARDARTLGEHLTTRAGVPVIYESEVFTSAEARRAPAKEGKSRAPKQHPAVDASAAALILTSYFSPPTHE